MSGGGSGAGWVFFFAILIGGTLSYWFYDSGHLAQGASLDLTRNPILPIQCTIATDRSADNRESAQAYFMTGSVRLDFQQKGAVTVSAHEIVKPNNMDYVWRDDSGYGKVSREAEYHVLDNIAKGQEWFCFPWFIPNFSAFDIPGNVTFE